MQRLPVEAWTAILCITAGPLDDLDEITGAEGHVSSWRTCLRVEVVSKGVRQHVHPCIAQMQVSHPRQLLILAWKIECAVKYFAALENQWLNEPDSLQQKTLYKSVFDAEVTFAIKFGLIHSYDVLEQENPRNVYMLSWLVRELQRSFGIGHMILDLSQEHSVFNVFQVDASLCRDDVHVSISDVEECVELVQLLWGVFNHAIKK